MALPLRSLHLVATAINVCRQQLRGRFVYIAQRSQQRFYSYHHQQSIKSPTCSLIDNGDILQLETGNSNHSFHASWLRFNCHCTECRQEHSGQRLIDVRALPKECKLLEANSEGDYVTLRWKGEEEHVGRISYNYLFDNEYFKEAYSEMNESKKVNQFLKKLPFLEYQDIQNRENFRSFLLEIVEQGACILRNVPTEPGTVLKVCEQIAPIQSTIYGKIFNVEATPQPINIAYSTAFLGYHMDLMYYESPPGIQALHCIRYDQSVVGGDSMLLDSFLVADELRRKFPEDFEVLSRVPATFQKMHYDRDFPVAMRYQRPHIMVNHMKEIIAVNWSPAFEGPLFVPEDWVEPYYKAYKRFTSLIEGSEHQVIYRLQPGDLLIFNNRRILHGRLSFNLNGGVRHLQGIYLNIDEFKSQVAIANKAARKECVIKRIGNQCYS